MTNWILGDKFDTIYPHKGCIKALWETRWKFACKKGVYPFHDGCYEDFEPIFRKLISENINDASTDEYTSTFFPTASELESRASEAMDAGHTHHAIDLFRRAAVVYRISRFPYVDIAQPDSIKRTAFDLQKKVYLKSASQWNPPIKEVTIPHTHRSGNDGPQIPIYIRWPSNARPEAPVPVIFIMTGLDGYRPDNSQRTHEITARGWAVVIAEIPGTADCPADPADPTSPDRVWDSIFAYMATQPMLDINQVVLWGLSAGGFYAIRAAHTHAARLRGAIAHGAGCHYFLDQEWLSRVDDHEYPFSIMPGWAKKYGYDDVQLFRQEAREKFSLLETGILDRPSCRLLLLNGVDDGVTPIEDSLTLFNHGSPKEGRFFEGLPHMGYPDSLPVAYKWLEDLLPSESRQSN
ncbi:heptaketide hydrolyase ayg1 [Aspergillus alliaceus]|uniref:heptaketide hydrolyase ayg1 n=1 Tax=Petromyces alliaceus TaxID=209559 RepID=UPI0012A5B02A|nr:Alpha/Beta hydrolase protein [Aspergillus alliaceus]KAB8229403.1 Alpha/Beta hydrolase protein [Aspergillus alliaceus]